MTGHLLSLAGIVLILAVAFALSSNRSWIRLRVVGAAFALQAGIAVLVLYVPAGRMVIEKMAGGVSALLGYAGEGTKFLFGAFAESGLGMNFALQAVPVVFFCASLVT